MLGHFWEGKVLQTHCGSEPVRRRVAAALLIMMGAGLMATSRPAEAASTLTMTAGDDLVNVKVSFAALGTSPTTIRSSTQNSTRIA